MIDDDNYTTMVQFSKEIESLVTQKKMEYIDAVIYFCEKHEIDVETAASLIKGNSNLKASIRIEAENLNYLPKTSRLPI